MESGPLAAANTDVTVMATRRKGIASSSDSSPLDLDDIDRALIAALIANGRASYAQLAPMVGLAQPTVRNRVQRLLDERVIVVGGRFDPAVLGLGVFAFILVKVASMIEDTARLISKIDEVAFEVVTAGRFDIVAELRCRDESHLVAAMDRVRDLPGVAGAASATVLGYDKQDWTQVGDPDPAPWSPPDRAPVDCAIDEIDRRLLDELARNGRATYASMGPAVGLSGAAVRERVLNLLEAGVVTVQAQPTPETVGIAGFCGVAIKANGSVASIAAAVSALPEATLVARTLGLYDMSVEVWHRDSEHLSSVLDELRRIPGVGTIDTVPYLQVVKEEYRLWI